MEKALKQRYRTLLLPERHPEYDAAALAGLEWDEPLRDFFITDWTHWDYWTIRRQPEAWLQKLLTARGEYNRIQAEMMKLPATGDGADPAAPQGPASMDDIVALRDLYPGAPDEMLRSLLES